MVGVRWFSRFGRGCWVRFAAPQLHCCLTNVSSIARHLSAAHGAEHGRQRKRHDCWVGASRLLRFRRMKNVVWSLSCYVDIFTSIPAVASAEPPRDVGVTLAETFT